MCTKYMLHRSTPQESGYPSLRQLSYFSSPTSPSSFSSSLPLSPSPFIISTQQMSHHRISWISCQRLKSCQSVGTPHTVRIVFIGHYLFVLIDSLFQHSLCSGGVGNHDRLCFLHVLSRAPAASPFCRQSNSSRWRLRSVRVEKWAP